MSTLVSADVPDDVMQALVVQGYTLERLSEEALRHYAGVLFARKALTLEQAARLAGMSLWEFLPFLGAQRISVADYDAEEIEKELETVRWLTSNPLK